MLHKGVCVCECVLPVGGCDSGSLCGQDGAASDVQAELVGRQVHLHPCFALIKLNQLMDQEKTGFIEVVTSCEAINLIIPIEGS